VRAVAVFLALSSSVAWTFTLADDILYHTPFVFGQWCGQPGLAQLGKNVCWVIYNYYYSLDAGAFDLASVALLSLTVTAICLAVLWAPRLGVWGALFRTFLVFVPLAILVFETLVYFLLNYWWTVHASGFLSGTPMTNEVVFWGAAATLAGGLSLEMIRRRSRVPGGGKG